MERNTLALRVGLFLLTGLAILGWMAVRFGRLGTGFQPYYPVKVEFENASGLLRGGDVLMSGAKVGFVKQEPVLTGQGFNVTTELYIRSNVKVPLGSVFIIQSSGLMGDAYISISAPSGSAAGSGYIQPGQTIKGARMASLNDVTAGGLDLVESLKQRLEDMRITVAKVNDGILGEENVTNLKAAIINLKEASESFKSASKRVDDFMTKSDETVVAAKEAIATLKGALGRVDGLAVKAEGAMAKVDDAAGELKATIVGVKEFAEAGEKTATASTELLKKMQSGSGTLPMLLNDSETRDNIESLLRNLKRFGVLFYRDRPAEPAEKPEKAAPPTKERRTR